MDCPSRRYLETRDLLSSRDRDVDDKYLEGEAFRPSKNTSIGQFTFDDIFRQSVNELLPPLLFTIFFLRSPISDFEFG